jgi:hypothetical protein
MCPPAEYCVPLVPQKPCSCLNCLILRCPFFFYFALTARSGASSGLWPLALALALVQGLGDVVVCGVGSGWWLVAGGGWYVVVSGQVLGAGRWRWALVTCSGPGSGSFYVLLRAASCALGSRLSALGSRLSALGAGSSSSSRALGLGFGR